ncbi:transferase family protein [Aspergillus sclerotioniger CBS 115572]|uniref:Transferase family protein n=1 Tax=Aspergillus sclerotioniger CBS 115572 TaxID=1450535 RepID=A0A317WBW4_9EURO|nr:transferase family protein [Aspergillus sclerotioniger CBS 115572]PWY83843.1 transferase family protein [Aspergillus sclerotioniger CBS 115572]
MIFKNSSDVEYTNSVLSDGPGSSHDILHDDVTVRETSHLILSIILEHALNKFDHGKDRFEGIADTFLPIIDQSVAARTRIEACLPAFPFKSANKVYKVLGTLPDKAEELALDRLNRMCVRIKEVYPPGARITIISDGITYNDLLCISDRDTWAYGEALREMAVQKQFTNVAFSRIKDLLDLPLPKRMSEIVYIANCTAFRRLLLNKYGNPDLDIDHEIATNPDTKLTYLGYKRFLESDLKHILHIGRDKSAHSYKQDCKYLAKQMLIRGYAFAGMIKDAFPNHLRLSIHESLSGNKLSISLLNTMTGFTTPWHCSVAQLANGEWVSAPMGEFRKDDKLELVYEDGRPSHFRQKASERGAGATIETMASYLRPAKALNASEYLNRALSSPSVSAESSTGMTLETQSHPSLVLSDLDLMGDDKPSGESLPNPAGASGSIPYGKRLIPQIMDNLAATEPERTVFSLTTLSGGSLGFRHISASTFTRAVDKTAWWLRGQLGKLDSIQPVGYIGPHDLRHVLLTYACVKAGYTALFLSPKNNTEGVLAVLEATKCNVWVNACDVTPVPLVKEVLEKRPMTLLQLPLLDELLDATPTEPFLYIKTFEEARDDPFCLLHTSGTTGAPKPIPWSHGLIGTMDAVRLLPPVATHDYLPPWTTDWNPGDTIYSSFPMSHGAGIIMDILMPALFNLRCILGPVDVPPNINLVEALAGNTRVDIWSMVPSLVDELGETPVVLSKLKTSKFICASGGPVSPVSAGKVNEIIRVLNLTGTTEGLFIGNLVPPRDDWFWFCFHPYSGFEFKEIEADTYEHWVHRNEHWELFQGIFHTFPDRQSINFKDLYMKHPTKPNLWAFMGRSDDLVVLSNGYKISPLETEALITTHPAINGCLIFGTGKPQAGLLIELKDPSQKTDELLDRIWETVKKANSMSRHKGQLLRDFVTFATPDKPFLRTDKGTVKRGATLRLYFDYIERFYSSRGEDLTDSFDMNMSSTEAIQENVRKIFASSVPEVQHASLDTDLFALGLDSLGVFAAIKTIRTATGLGDSIGPRHVYASRSVNELSATIVRLAAEAESNSKTLSSPGNSSTANIEHAVAQHKARQSFSLNAFDYVNPNHGMGLVFYFSVREGVSYEQVFDNLQEGLNRTFDLIPALSGKMMNCSEQAIGYTKGDLCVTIPPLSEAASVRNRLVYKDLSAVLPSFDKLREGGFAPSAFKDSLVLRDDPFPKMPADIIIGQANFVSGGCILAVDLNHCCLDGLGAMVAIKAWAENCRYLQGDESATCSWYDPESFNHSLPEILHEQEGWARPLDTINPGTWGFLPFVPPDENSTTNTKSPDPNGVSDTTLSPRPLYPLHPIWPLPRAERCLKTTLLSITPENIEAMKQEVLSDPTTNGLITSISDILQAFIWRAAIRARYRPGRGLHPRTPRRRPPILLLPLTPTYMGSMLILNRCTMPIKTLCAPETTIGQVALMLRQSAARITPSLVHDAFTILQSLPDHSRFSTANMGLEHMHAMISNMLLFPADEIRFGTELFGNGGSPESMRPQLERGNGRFRFLAVLPMKRDGGVDLALGTHPEELQMLWADEEFVRYVDVVDVSG